MNVMGISIFAPGWLTIWVAVASVAAYILKFKQLGLTLLMWPVTDWLLLPIVEPWIDEMPMWIVVVILLIFVMAILRWILSLVLSKEGIGHVEGIYMVRFIDFIFLLPFRLIRLIVRLFSRNDQ